MRTQLWTLCLAALATAAVPPAAEAQGILNRIERGARERVENRTAQTEERILQKTGDVVDAAMSPLGERVDSAVSRTAAAADSAVQKANQAIARALRGEDAEVKRLREALEAGGAVLPEISFEPGADRFLPDAEPHLAQLAEAIEAVPGSFLIEGHVDPGPNPTATHSLAEARAAAVKDWLVGAGIAASRIFAMGRGAASPSGGEYAPARIEVVRVQ